MSGLWDRPARLGFHESIKGIGGIVAPLLAGFALATIAALASAEKPPRLRDEAILALTTALSLLLYSMQVAFMALQHHASPSEILAWYPEASVNKLSLNDVRQRQANAAACVRFYAQRHSTAYEFGLMMFLLGLGLLVWPNEGDASVGRIGALIVVGLALLIEVWWSAARHYNAREERKGSNKRLPGPAAATLTRQGMRLRIVENHRTTRAPAVQPARPTAIAGVLDPDRRDAANLKIVRVQVPGSVCRGFRFLGVVMECAAAARGRGADRA